MKRREDMHWSDVKASLEKKGSSLADVASKLGLTKQSMTKVKHQPYARIESAIAKELDKDPQAIWPTRYYHSNGSPIRPSIWMMNNSRQNRVAQVKKKEAA